MSRLREQNPDKSAFRYSAWKLPTVLSKMQTGNDHQFNTAKNISVINEPDASDAEPMNLWAITQSIGSLFSTGWKDYEKDNFFVACICGLYDPSFCVRSGSVCGCWRSDSHTTDLQKQRHLPNLLCLLHWRSVFRNGRSWQMKTKICNRRRKYWWMGCYSA